MSCDLNNGKVGNKCSDLVSFITMDAAILAFLIKPEFLNPPTQGCIDVNVSSESIIGTTTLVWTLAFNVLDFTWYPNPDSFLLN